MSGGTSEDGVSLRVGVGVGKELGAEELNGAALGKELGVAD